MTRRLTASRRMAIESRVACRPSVVLTINGEGALEERRVKRGLATPERVEIMEGLQEGETVVAANAGQLKAGDRVTPKMMTAEASR